jgi:subtilisin family serine protease
LDGGIDANHPAIKGSVVAARDFSGSHTTDDETTGQGHATGLAGLYVGHDSGYTGLAPQASIINVRVITSKDYTDDRMAGAGVFYALNNGAKVLNLSFGNKLGDGPLTSKFNLIVDYVAENYGASVVSAAGNEDDTAVNQTPAGAFNGWCVGALAPSSYNQVSTFSNFALNSDRRSKPDLVAPGEGVQRANANWETSSDYSQGSGTSFSTPIVGGVLAQMIGYGQSHGLPTDPRLLRAITMTSAVKEHDTEGDPWTPRHQTRDKRGRTLIDRPLDDEQGAGRIDGVAAYDVYAQHRDASTAVAEWAYTSLKRDRTFILDLGRVSRGQRIDATVAWDHHVGRKDDGDGVVDEGDRFFETSVIANFALMLLKDGRIVATSNSPYDNVEHFSLGVKNAGDYAVQVYRTDEGGERNETFGVAARVLNNPPALGSISSLALPATETAGVQRSIDDPTSVPEPGSLGAIVALASIAGLGGRRRRR